MTPSGDVYPLQHRKWAIPRQMLQGHIDILVFLDLRKYNENIWRHIFGQQTVK